MSVRSSIGQAVVDLIKGTGTYGSVRRLRATRATAANAIAEMATPRSVVVCVAGGKVIDETITAKLAGRRLDVLVYVGVTDMTPRAKDVDNGQADIDDCVDQLLALLAGANLEIDGVSDTLRFDSEEPVELPGGADGPLEVYQLAFRIDADLVSTELADTRELELIGSINIPAPDDAANPLVQVMR